MLMNWVSPIQQPFRENQSFAGFCQDYTLAVVVLEVKVAGATVVAAAAAKVELAGAETIAAVAVLVATVAVVVKLTKCGARRKS
jgi:hypothetical protein